MTPVTQLLQAANNGDRQAAAELLPLVYDELRKLAAARMAQEKLGHTLQPTALVHEAYLRLVGEPSDGSRQVMFEGRGHFFAAAAEAMRRILIESARRKQALKNGGQVHASDADLDQISVTSPCDPLELLAIHEALDRLADRSPRKAELVKLRYFLGCTLTEAAEILGIAPKTVEEDWTYARAWLRRQLHRDGSATSD